MNRILFLVTSADIGGAQRHVFFSAKKAKKDGFDVWLGSGSGGWLSEEIEKEGIKSVFFKNLKRSLNPVWSCFFVFELRKFIKKEKINIISFNGSNSLFGVLGLLDLKEKPKTIFTVHGWSYLSPGFKKSFLAKVIVWISMKAILPLMDEIIFVCNYDRELGRKLKLIKENQGRVEYNKIDNINFLSKEEAKRELMIPAGKIIIGSVTRLEYAKNNEMLINAFSKLNTDKVICVIIGNGPEKEKIKSQVLNLKTQDKIFLLGDIPDAAKYLKAFDIFVMCSRYEGMPYALLEAMAAGLPIIATRVGGIPETLGGKGIMIKANNVEELKNNLDRLIENLLSRSFENNHYCFEKNGSV